MVKGRAMKSSKRSSGRRLSGAALGRRARLLAAFARSGLSAAAFARRHRLTYTTFCGWRARRAKAKTSPAFVQVELGAEAVGAELTIELPAGVRLRIESVRQIGLAVKLIQALSAGRAC